MAEERPRLNKDWHLAHKMPKKATIQEKIAWHTEHEKICSCRPMPSSIKKLVQSFNPQK